MTRRHHQEPTVDMSVTLAGVHSVGVDNVQWRVSAILVSHTVVSLL